MKRLLILFFALPILTNAQIVSVQDSSGYLFSVNPLTGAKVQLTIPQTGQSGKVLSTDGVRFSWLTPLSNPMTTGGDLIYGGASGTPTRLPNGTANFVLQSNGTTLAPSWVALAGGGNALTSNPLSQFASTTSAQFMGVISDATGSSGVVVGNASPTFTGLIQTNNIHFGFQAITTATGTTTLSVASPYRTAFTGTLTQICKLPAANTLPLGTEYYIDNNSTAAITMQDNGGNTIYTLAALHDAFFVATDISTANGVWDMNGFALLETANTFTAAQTVPTLNATTIVATAGTFQNMVVQTTGTAATWTVPAALQVTGAKWKITIIGAGGGGGGTNTTAGQVGGGGASGGVVVYYCTWVAGQTTMTYTVGAAGIASATNAAGGTGGNTSITYNAVTITANGGVGGPSSTAAAGAAGGSAAGGTLNLAGNNGTPSGTMAATNNLQGNGANTPLGYGSGGQEVFTAAGGNGLTGQGYGSGGSGGKNGTGTTARTGAAGTGGLIIIEY